MQLPLVISWLWFWYVCNDEDDNINNSSHNNKKDPVFFALNKGEYQTLVFLW